MFFVVALAISMCIGPVHSAAMRQVTRAHSLKSQHLPSNVSKSIAGDPFVFSDSERRSVAGHPLRRLDSSVETMAAAANGRFNGSDALAPLPVWPKTDVESVTAGLAATKARQSKVVEIEEPANASVDGHWLPLQGDLLLREEMRKKQLTTKITNEQCDQWLADATRVADGFTSGEISTSGRPFAMFTSAGNYSNVKAWLEGDNQYSSNRMWDLIVHSYADCDDPAGASAQLNNMADVFSCGPGDKYGSLDAMYQADHSVVSSYLCVGVIDDDAHGVDVGKLNELCEIVLREKLIVLSPAVSGHMVYQQSRPHAGGGLRRTTSFDMTYNIWSAPWLSYYLSMRETRLWAYHEQMYFKNLLGFSKYNHNDCMNQFFAVSDRIVFHNPDTRPNGLREVERMKQVVFSSGDADVDQLMDDLRPWGFCFDGHKRDQQEECPKVCQHYEC